jgi:hypothetical protein
MKNCSRRLLALLASALLAGGALACDSSSSSSSTAPVANNTASTSTSGGYLKEDADSDGDDPHTTQPGQDDQEFLAGYGPLTDPATTSTIASVVRRYYAASVAGNGAGACALLNAALATSLAGGQGQAAGTCATGIAPVLTEQHQRLRTEEPATMTVIGVRAKGNLALAILGFKHAPESDILLQREDNTWKIDALYDSLMR